MKKTILSIAVLAMVGATATAQENNDGLAPIRPLTSGGLFQGMSCAIPMGRVVLSYGSGVTFNKTVHLIFPFAIRYVDLGSQNITADKAEDAENALRVKASVKDFETETNMSAICEDSPFYAFNVKYADKPERLSIKMKDFFFITEGRLPGNRSDIYFEELGSESPVLVKLMMQTTYQNDRRCTKHIGAQQFGMKSLLRGLYAHNGLLYFHTYMENGTNMPYSVDLVTFEVADKKMAKRTAIQEQVFQPFRAYHQVMQVRGMGSEHTVFASEQLSFAGDKQLEVTPHERNGGRTLIFHVTAEDLQLAKKIDNLKLKR